MSILEAYLEHFGLKLSDLPPIKEVNEEALANKISQSLGLTGEHDPHIRYDPKKIFRVICEYMNVKPEHAMMPNRKTEYRICRHLFYYFMVEINNNGKMRISLVKIGQSLSCEYNPRGFDHCTVMFGHTSISNDISINTHTHRVYNTEIKKIVDEIWEKI
jgi:chromosomal replication initiation ATPase DnaA